MIDPIPRFRHQLENRVFDTPWGDRRCERVEASPMPEPNRINLTLRFDDGRELKLKASWSGLEAAPDDRHRNTALLCIQGWLDKEAPESDEIDLLSGKQGDRENEDPS